MISCRTESVHFLVLMNSATKLNEVLAIFEGIHL